MSACEFKLILDATNFVADDLDKLRALGCFETVMEEDGIHAYCAFLCNDASPMTVISDTFWEVESSGYKVNGIIWRKEAE